MKKCLNRLASLGLVLVLAGCSSAPPPPPTTLTHPLEQNALDAMALNLPEQAEMALREAVAHFESLDDLSGQWRVRHQLLLFTLQHGDRDEARKQLAILEPIARQIGTRDVLFKTLLTMGRVLEDDRYYSEAASYAGDTIDRAVIAAYLGNTSEAVALSAEAPAWRAADRAFVLYQHARSVGTIPAYRDALAAYRTAQDSRGIADCLMSMARIARADGDTSAARSFARRAERTLNAAGASDLAASVNAWLKAL